MQISNSLKTGSAELGSSLCNEQLIKLQCYQQQLEKWNSVFNLTAIKNIETSITHHFLDSIAILPYLEKTNLKNLIDVGTGAGFPGLVIAILKPNWQIKLVDTSQKKTAFLTQLICDLKLDNVDVINQSIERVDCLDVDRYSKKANQFMIVSRAFAKLDNFYRVTKHLRAITLYWFAMKGSYPHDELSDLSKIAKIWDVFKLNVPNLQAERHLVQFSSSN